MNVSLINFSTDIDTNISDNSSIKFFKVTDKDMLKDADAIVIFEDENFDSSEVCSWLVLIRKINPTLVWIVVDSCSVREKNVYWYLGAAGILSNEYSLREIQLIITNTLSCFKIQNEKKREPRIKFELDPQRLEMRLDDFVASLTRLEFCFMQILYRNIGRVCTYDEIGKELAAIIGSKQRTKIEYRIANIVFCIRKKISKSKLDSSEVNIIRTIRSRGYTLDL